MDVKRGIKKALQGALMEILSERGVIPRLELSAIPLEFPAELQNGDYASPVAFAWSKSIGTSPRELAEALLARIPSIDGVSKIEIAGPGFINFHLAPSSVAASLQQAMSEDAWGSSKKLAGQKTMVEYTDPNPFKEFHIGHLMSNAIGESISRVLQFAGAEIKRANYQGDVGPHVAKAIWGKLQKPELAWGAAYAYGAKEYESHKEEIDSINAKVYARDDDEITALYDAGRKDSLDHFEELYKLLGTKFDFYFFESETAGKGMAVVGANSDMFELSDGAVVYKGEQDGLHTRVFITSKGLPTYETKELGLAQLKEETWPPEVSITVTAHEQADYFAVVLAAMRKVMPEIAKKIRHVSHGMMRLTTGKMSSRTGDVITGESLLNDLIEQAKIRAAESRAEDTEQLARDVAVAAIKYQILKQASGKDIVFDRERALSLEGDSGPYLQYAHARASTIVEKAKEQGVMPHCNVAAPASDLARIIHRFPEIIERAAHEYEPHHITNYLLQVAAEFNRWYAQEMILDGTGAAPHKVAITATVARTLKNGLWILGVPAPEKM